MASSPPKSTTPTSRPPSSATPVPPPVPVDTHPNRAGLRPRQPLRPALDPSRLAPEDAYFAHTLPRLRPLTTAGNHAANPDLLNRVVTTPAAVAALRPPPAVPRIQSKSGAGARSDRGRSRRRKRQWKKLLWVKQSYPDNYTDTETFLDHLQRNPRLRPYDFWPLVADFTVIVQHVCSVVIYICCFTVIFQERVSPVSVASWATLCTIFCWGLWDYWEGNIHLAAEECPDLSSAHDGSNSGLLIKKPADGLGLSLNMSNVGSPPSRQSTISSVHSDDTSATSIYSVPSPDAVISPVDSNLPVYPPSLRATLSNSVAKLYLKPFPAPYRPSRGSQRLITAKSALLIFCALQGLSPILKSLTKSTTSDSIWAMSCWLMIINVFFFDYGSGSSVRETPQQGNNAGAGAVAARFPASLSTNAALMASTVLASRLESATHVFSLTLFSIEVFGLFPIFRRHLRTISWRGHITLTITLVISAAAAVGVTLKGGCKGGALGILFGAPLTALVMGGCSWWLIGLQKYKNVVTGPWDQAKPILRRRHWD
ncbi:glycosylphosphatidylinositol anchor biosynthesis [Ophidiomyces ophidiicola]|nr:glycosylphosphatidylinositol anchor biosynthesis [Ophidiomyces ophidiicola]